MRTDIELQPSFSYGYGYIVLLFVLLLIASLVYMIIKKKRYGLKEAVKKENITQAKDKESIRKEYIQELTKLEMTYSKGEISSRKGYQRLSSILRGFVGEYTGKDVETKTLKELKGLKIPKLEKSIASYYEPEFSPSHCGDLSVAIEKTKRVIEKWK